MKAAGIRRDLPTGTVTFVFTDIEGSTRLLEDLGVARYGELLSQHHRVCRVAWETHGGVEVDTAGDAFFVVFRTASGALSAAGEAQEALAELGLPVRMGVHTGEVSVNETGYVGFEVHRAARIAAAAHGGQVVVSGAAAAQAGTERLAELGEHRFKDITEPMPMFQLGEGSFPPLKTISNTNLPRPASSFVGRERELGDVLARIEQGARLVTLTGPGGSGKTRLALEAAATLVPEYTAGVFWVGLASLRDPELVTEAVSKTLGAKNGLAEHVGERELLLLLDNLEQVIDAAPELSALLRACQNLTMLVTSREVLRVDGEIEYPVPPLAETEAVALFCERAHTEPTDEIRELCARLDNLPLAVELAAARTKALSPGQILERLSQRLDLLKGGRDADPRQQTLRATIEWSYDLLSEDEQRLFRALSVFAGGCTLEAAEEVADADLDTLQSLVEKSLLRFTNQRYWMLETIRGFGFERLRLSEEVETVARHARFFVEFAVRNEEQVQSNRAALLDVVELERANIAAAVESLAAAGEGDAARRLVGSLWVFWFFRGRFREGQSLADIALAAPPEGSPEARVDALWGSAKFSMFAGDIDRAAAAARELLVLGERHGLPRGIAIATELLAMVEAMRGESEAARPLYERSLELARDANDAFLLASVTNNLGSLDLEDGKYGAASRLFEESAGLGRVLGDPHRISIALANLGFAQHLLGSAREARSHFAESLEIAASVEYREGVAFALFGLALTEEPARGALLLGSSDSIADELGLVSSPLEQRLREQVLSAAEAALGENACREAFRRGRAMSIEDVVPFALPAS